MKIKIDMELLAKQIKFCDEFASIYAESPVKELKETSEQFEGIANLLNEIYLITETGQAVHFEVCKEKENED